MERGSEGAMVEGGCRSVNVCIYIYIYIYIGDLWEHARVSYRRRHVCLYAGLFRLCDSKMD